MTRGLLLLLTVVGLAIGAGPGGYWGGGPGGIPAGFTLTGTIQALNLTATNNVSGNDVAAADSLTAVTGNFSGAIYGSTNIQAGSAGIFPTVYNAVGVYYIDGSMTGGLSTARLYGFNGAIISGGTVPRVIIGGAGEAATATTNLVSRGGTTTGLLNLVQSPDFAAATGWTLTGCSITGGKLQKLTAAGAGTATQLAANMPLVASEVYLIRLDVDSLSAGHDIILSMGGTTFGTITAEGSNQWFRGTTANASGVLSLAWANGETGIVDNMYVYRLAGKMTIGGSFWNQACTSTATTYTVLDGDHVLSVSHADSMVVTLPALSACWDAVTSTGRELVIENAGTGFCVITTPAGDASLNAIAGADSLHLAQYAVATLRAISASHWAVAE